MRRRSFFAISLIAVLNLAASVMAAPPFQQDPGPDGIVCVEAEDFDNKVKAPNGDEWVLVGPSGGFTGTAGMQALPNNNNSNHNSPGYSTSSCRLDYQINFVKTGTYYVWVYGYGANGNDDSCHAGLDGQEIATCDNMSGWNGRYAWSDGTLDGPVSTFDITAVGVHTLNMYMREDGMIIDKVLLTANATYDAPTHLLLYKTYDAIGGIVHTHSTYATSWAQAGKAIPPFGTTHADHFYGAVPCSRKLTRKEIVKDYEANTGKVIIEALKDADPLYIPSVLVNSHGPFCWGKNAEDAVYNAVALEEIARMAFYTILLGRNDPVEQYLLDKHFLRKHGKDAYYGQGRFKKSGV